MFEITSFERYFFYIYYDFFNDIINEIRLSHQSQSRLAAQDGVKAPNPLGEGTPQLTLNL